MHTNDTHDNPLATVVSFSITGGRPTGSRGGKCYRKEYILCVKYGDKNVEIDLTELFSLHFPASHRRIKGIDEIIKSAAPSEVIIRFLPSGAARILSNYTASWLDRIKSILRDKKVPNFQKYKTPTYSG